MQETETSVEEWTNSEGRENDRSLPNKAIHEYNHGACMNDVESMYKELEALKENIMKNSVRCHILQVDLATQFNPQTVDTIRKTETDCKKCTTKLQTIQRNKD